MNRLARLSILAPAVLALGLHGRPALAHGDSATLVDLTRRAPVVAVVHVVGDVPAPLGYRSVQLQTLALLKGAVPAGFVLTAPAAPGLAGVLATARAGSRLLVFLQVTPEGFAPVHGSSAALPMAQQELLDHVRALVLADATDPLGDSLRNVLLDGLASAHPRVAADAATALGVDRNLHRLAGAQRDRLTAALGSSLQAGDPRLPGLLLAAGRLHLAAAPTLVAGAFLDGTAPRTAGLQEDFLSRCGPERLAAAVADRLDPTRATRLPGTAPSPLPPERVLRATRLLVHAADHAQSRPLLAAIAVRDADRGLQQATDAATTLARRALSRQGLTANRSIDGRTVELHTARTPAPEGPAAPTFRCIRPRRMR